MEKQTFSKKYESVDIILDTNVLLYLFKCSFGTCRNLVQLFNKVSDITTIPYRVLQEYNNNKLQEQSKIDKKYDSFTKEVKKKINEFETSIKKSIAETRKYDFPDSDTLEQQLTDILQGAQYVVDQYDSSLEEEKKNKNLQSNLIEKLIDSFIMKGRITVEPSIVKILSLIQEGEVRYRYKMPPGYMDEKDKDKQVQKDSSLDNFNGRIRKYGDFLIWKDLLDFSAGRDNKERLLIFVTNDTKEDWWSFKDNQRNIPDRMRPELLSEYYTIVGNKQIEFMTLKTFYEMFSDYFQIQDVKTKLELEYDEYINGIISEKHHEYVDQSIHNSINVIDWSGLGYGTVDGNPNVNFGDILICETNIHYDDEGEHAIYDVQIQTDTEPILLEIQNRDANTHINVVTLCMSMLIHVRRDLRDLDDEQIEISGFTYSVIDEKKYTDSSAVLMIGSLYISIVFVCMAVAMLALKSLTSIGDDKIRYNMLYKIGVDKDDQGCLLFKQNVVFFFLPFVIPVLLSIPIGVIFGGIFKLAGFNSLYSTMICDSLLIALIITVIYVLYFVATYVTVKRNVVN